jgi:hypothetical protein
MSNIWYFLEADCADCTAASNCISTEKWLLQQESQAQTTVHLLGISIVTSCSYFLLVAVPEYLLACLLAFVSRVLARSRGSSTQEPPVQNYKTIDTTSTITIFILNEYHTIPYHPRQYSF